MALKGRRIIVGVSGGVAAYKTPELVRRLNDQGADVRVVMTRAAQAFITPLTLQAVSGHRVHDELLDTEAEAGMGHIELARWADDVLIAPATADLMARLANGHADDLLTTLVLATRARIWLAPAMNQAMWAHPAVVENRDRLVYRGLQLLGPDAGSQACGDEGYGRMRSPDDLVADLIERRQVHRFGAPQPMPELTGCRVVITAGPTLEDLDPVRYIANRSSGRMGFAVAQACLDQGADVALIAGPVQLPTPPGVQRVDVRSANEMLQAVMQALPADVFIGVAAVADYRPADVAASKMKKDQDTLRLALVKNPDILAAVTQHDPRPYTVGFAAETDRLEAHAKDKLNAKALDLIAANWVAEGRGFDADTNALEVFGPEQRWSLPEQPKARLARQLVSIISEQIALKA
ncbi:MAG: bifunctional phosphopantothenoylcysteine decarboxylase/phosphopantothenate--cysteine ligase CoaBC [Pseudomonadota bacterium]